MEPHPPTTPADPPDPPQGRSAPTMPTGIAAVLHVLRILLSYGRHLADTARDRAAAPNFTSVAVCFGTGQLQVILAHLQRGILRAIALERVLLARAARGRDMTIPPVRLRRAVAQPLVPPEAAAAEPPASAQPAPAKAQAAGPACQAGWEDDPVHYMPTLKELEARARRRPVGQTIIEICLDLAVVPGFCTGAFWNALSDAVTSYGGNLVTLMRERSRRAKAFEREQDRAPAQNWPWWEATREAFLQALGFRIGETPAMPVASVPVAAAARRPP